MALPWYHIKDEEKFITPSLVIFPDRIKKNISKMISMAGGVAKLRPHIKTHKMAEVIALQIEMGIYKFKCATITEADLLAKSGAKDVLLAVQPVGNTIFRFFKLIEKYPKTTFSTLVDNVATLNELAKEAEAKKIKVALWLDINNGMDRSGTLLDQNAIVLYKQMYLNTHILAMGFHVYDGHIHDANFEARKKVCDEAFIPVLELKQELIDSGITIPTIIAGGTPTFPIHIHREDVETSPGTPLLWDAGYAQAFKDLPFLNAAVLLTKVISQPNKNLICVDLGHKSVASEMALPRVKFLNWEVSKQISQSEEHLVIEMPNNSPKIGAVGYALPIHICPTVTKYNRVQLAINNEIKGTWKVAARDHNMDF